MNQNISDTLKANYHIWESFKLTGNIPDISSDRIRDIGNAWMQHFNKSQTELNAHRSCSGCFVDLIRQIFNAYENHLKDEQKESGTKNIRKPVQNRK